MADELKSLRRAGARLGEVADRAGERKKIAKSSRCASSATASSRRPRPRCWRRTACSSRWSAARARPATSSPASARRSRTASPPTTRCARPRINPAQDPRHRPPARIARPRQDRQHRHHRQADLRQGVESEARSSSTAAKRRCRPRTRRRSRTRRAASPASTARGASSSRRRQRRREHHRHAARRGRPVSGTYSGDRGSGDIRNGTFDGTTVEFIDRREAARTESRRLGLPRHAARREHDGTVSTTLGTFPFRGARK